MPLTINEVQERFHYLAFGHVPNQKATVVPGTQQHIGIVWVGLQNKCLAFVSSQFFAQDT